MISISPYDREPKNLYDAAELVQSWCEAIFNDVFVLVPYASQTEKGKVMANGRFKAEGEEATPFALEDPYEPLGVELHELVRLQASAFYNEVQGEITTHKLVWYDPPEVKIVGGLVCEMEYAIEPVEVCDVVNRIRWWLEDEAPTSKVMLSRYTGPGAIWKPTETEVFEKDALISQFRYLFGTWDY